MENLEPERISSESNAIVDASIKEESESDGEFGYYQDRDDFVAPRETFTDSSVDSLIEDVDCLM